MKVRRFILAAAGLALSASAVAMPSTDRLAAGVIERLDPTAETSSVASSMVDASRALGELAAPAAISASKTDITTSGPSSVPEPASIALFGIAGAALVASRRRRARSV